MTRFVAVVSTALLICLIIAIAVYVHVSGTKLWQRAPDTAAVVKEVRRLNELATVRYSIEKVVAMKEDKSPVGTESILLLVQGKVLAGVNLADLTPDDVTFTGRDAVNIHLTNPHLQDAFLDEKYTRVWDRSITWWTPWVSPDLDLEHKARLRALDDIKSAALDMGILAEAKRNAEIDITSILQAFGMAKINFYYGT